MFKTNYNSKHEKQKDKLEHIVNLYNCGLNNYKKYNKLKKKLENLGDHNPDYKIILDAHDLSLKCNVSSNTTDKEFYDIIKKCNFLNIDSINLLN